MACHRLDGLPASLPAGQFWLVFEVLGRFCSVLASFRSVLGRFWVGLGMVCGWFGDGLERSGEVCGRFGEVLAMF